MQESCGARAVDVRRTCGASAVQRSFGARVVPCNRASAVHELAQRTTLPGPVRFAGLRHHQPPRRSWTYRSAPHSSPGEREIGTTARGLVGVHKKCGQGAHPAQRCPLGQQHIPKGGERLLVHGSIRTLHHSTQRKPLLSADESQGWVYTRTISSNPGSRAQGCGFGCPFHRGCAANSLQ